jgi:hypothetical protein
MTPLLREKHSGGGKEVIHFYTFQTIIIAYEEIEQFKTIIISC